MDPLKTATALQTPTFVIQGGRGYRVTVDNDYDAWTFALCGKGNLEFSLYLDLDHVCAPGQSPSSPSEYDEQGNVDHKVINDIVKWLCEIQANT